MNVNALKFRFVKSANGTSPQDDDLSTDFDPVIKIRHGLSSECNSSKPQLRRYPLHSIREVDVGWSLELG